VEKKGAFRIRSGYPRSAAPPKNAKPRVTPPTQQAMHTSR
jgi:hypothetical protein